MVLLVSFLWLTLHCLCVLHFHFSISLCWSSYFTWKVFLKYLVILGYILRLKRRQWDADRKPCVRGLCLSRDKRTPGFQYLRIFYPRQVVLKSLAGAENPGCQCSWSWCQRRGALGTNTIFSLPLSYTWCPNVQSPETFHFLSCGAADIKPFHLCRNFYWIVLL